VYLIGLTSESLIHNESHCSTDKFARWTVTPVV